MNKTAKILILSAILTAGLLGTATFAAVTQTPPPTPPPAQAVCTVDTFSAADSVIDYGETTTLSWTTSNCGYVSVDHGVYIGTIADGSAPSSQLYTTTTFKITAATSIFASISDTATYTVTVNPNQTFYECNDGSDNDGDGDVDYPNDAGCTSLTDNTEDSNSGGNGNEPDVETLNAYNIDEDSATLKGEVDPNGDDTRVWFEFGEDYNDDETNDENIGDGTGDETFTDTISGLDSDTEYEFRICAENSYGTECGDIETFRTDDDNGSSNNNPYYPPYNPYYGTGAYTYNPLPPTYDTPSYPSYPQIIYATSGYSNDSGMPYDNNADYGTGSNYNGAYNYELGASAASAGYGLNSIWVWLFIILLILGIVYLSRKYNQ